MGLSSSQARLLDLTARMHQIEYKAAKLEAQKLQMANESTRVYEEYLEALDKTKIQYKVLTTDGSTTYQDITSYDDFLEAGYALDYNGTVYDGTTKTWNQLLSALGITTVSGNFETLITNIINSGEVTIVAAKSDGTFASESDSDFTDYETSVSTNTGLQEVSDEVALKKAEAQYEADMKKIDNKDTKFDTDLAALETERSAIKEEIDTLKTVASDNVERTFKLFS
ncbi:MAG: hypothetical protein LUB59_04175 [Candidatus Gastranaerophilales bacterium]|nr:hypothetical protein [Candidatus Gastranaerophilales bacterium]